MSGPVGSGRGNSGFRRAFLGLGSNVGDRVAHLNRAVAMIPDVDAVSSVYETEPVGGPEQDLFLNLVVRLDTNMSPRRLLEVCREREAEAKRLREIRWGPRTLDVDLLWIDGVTVDEPDLIVPHPRMFGRAFVLVPLADVGADVLPDGFEVTGASATEGLNRLGPLHELVGP